MALERLYPQQFNQTTICILAKTGFNVGDNDYYLADSKDEYLSYIKSVMVDQQTDFSYVGADRPIRYNGNAEDIINGGCDYVAWQNKYFSNQWWFAYIDKVTYINPNTSEISVTVDVIATFIYSIKIGNQYCTRLTTPTDDYGQYLANEGLPCDEYVYSLWQKPVITGVGGGTLDTIKIAVFGYGNDIPVAHIDGVPVSGNIRIWSNAGDLYSDLQAYLDNEKATVYNVYAIPHFAVGGDGLLASTDITFSEFSIDPLNAGYPFQQITPADQGGWRPNNYKLYCYPFTALYVTNNIGNSQYYRYENFTDQAPSFVCACNHLFPVTPTIYPKNYEGSNGNRRGINDQYAFDLGSMPQIGYTGDGYGGWMAANGSSLKMEMLGSLIGNAFSMAGAYATGDAEKFAKSAMGSASSLTQTIMSQQARKLAASHQPPKTVSSNAVSNAFMTIGSNEYGPRFARAQIPQYLAKQYDDYLSLYGYKYDKTYKIDLFEDRRPLFNYYETLGAHISANIPMEYARQIEQIFDSGVRFWYNPNKIGDYTDANLKENSLH